MNTAHRINHQPAFLLCSAPWRENSLKLEIFSRDYGRVALLARSARTRGSELRGVLSPFIPFSVSWFGKEELKTLHRAEWIGGWPQPQNRSLFSALYVNELVWKLTAREDPHPQLFDALSHILRRICLNTRHTAALRCFEWQLLGILGYAPDTQHDIKGLALTPEHTYAVIPEYPLQRWHGTPPHNGICISGSLLHKLAEGCLNEEESRQVLPLTRLLLDHYLPAGIGSRTILRQIGCLKSTAFPHSR